MTVTERGWVVARTMMSYGSSPAEVVEYLRLLHRCKQCGARPLYPCRRGLGEVRATHLQRGA